MLDPIMQGECGFSRLHKLDAKTCTSTLALAPRRQHLCFGFVTLSLRCTFVNFSIAFGFCSHIFFLLWLCIVWLIGWHDFGPDFEMGKPKASNRINVKHFPVAQEIEILQFTDQKVKEVAQFQRKRNEMVHYLSFQGRCTYWATNIAVKQKERSSLKREIWQTNDSPQEEQLLGLGRW